MQKGKHQARLWLAWDAAALDFRNSEHFSRCNASSLSAASQLLVDDRPVATSLIDEGASPTLSPISESVMPEARKSRIREGQLTMVPQSLRHDVNSCQRQSVTVLRDNVHMPRQHDLPRFLELGARVRWWRERRGMTRKELAKKVGLGYSTVSDLENGQSNSTAYLYRFAAALQLSLSYLETDKGDPEIDAPPPLPDPWPFQAVSHKSISNLNMIERSFVETALISALQKIESERRRIRRA